MNIHTLTAIPLSCSSLVGQIGGRELTRNTHHVLAFFNVRKACGLLRVLLHQSSALADKLVNDVRRHLVEDGQSTGKFSFPLLTELGLVENLEETSSHRTEIDTAWQEEDLCFERQQIFLTSTLIFLSYSCCFFPVIRREDI
jgi:hypothetical protein